MERDIQTNKHSSSLLSPKNLPPTGRSMKRDEWSEEAVSCLLEAYEAKWSLRSRAKLKGRDWHDVAASVSAGAKSAKTHTQCKNKIESLKKRYRSEMAAESSSWPLYQHIDRLLRGAPANISSKSESSNKRDTVRDPINVGTEIRVNRKRKMEREDMMMGWVAEIMARNEEARMETMRETERIRMEAEEKRGELEVKRTQIMADVQLQIAKLFGVYSHNLIN